jgi:hypothetical protein
MTPRVRYEIIVHGVVRIHRDDREVALEADDGASAFLPARRRASPERGGGGVLAGPACSATAPYRVDRL